jgi:uncharacterized protein (DUF488 family)
MVREKFKMDLVKNQLFSIGHSNHSIKTFLRLLAMHQIQVLADVRSHPYSRFATHFRQSELKSALSEKKIKYCFLGEQLGGRPGSKEFYDAEGHVLYSLIAQTDFFQVGITRLESEMRNFRVAMMCSEENPAECHRRLLVGRVLTQHGFFVSHIRGDGRIQNEEEVAQEDRTVAGETVNFFV